MNMPYKTPLFISTLFFGAALLYLLGGIALAAVYAILWIDKIVLGMLGPIRYLGVEFTTLATIILGISYGPLPAFLFSIIVIPLLHSSKYLFLPLPQPEWPFFIPHPNNIVDAIGALCAGILWVIGIKELLILTAIVVIIKDAGYGISEKMMFGKPVDYFSAAMYLIFNCLLIFQFGPSIASLAA
ncbi:MAG: hypothetical protein HY364_04505 [Candidatus Aenigmarchaeota archaeon]|nr:hypothetical protein [Candidatus Aenigmarchaeota archaeon]